MKTVFLVDSSASFLQYLGLVIKRLGYDTVTAGTGDACLEGIRKNVPDMVMCEAVLPDRGGVELCRKIKADPETRDAHVVLVTTNGGNGTRSAAMKNGASDFLAKPVTMRAVFNVLEQHIGFRRRKQIRTPYRTPVKVKGGSSRPRILETSSLGEGGMFLKSEESYPVGEVLDLRFALNGSSSCLSVSGEVVYAFRMKAGNSAPGMGIRFVDLDHEQQSLLAGHIENYITGSRA
jgi:twitching motility two-component system response regulator PilH